MKSMMRCGMAGLLAGAALNQMVCLALSYGLELGYYAPCFAGFEEILGGELNAAAVQTLGFAVAGAAVGAAIGRRKRKRGRNDDEYTQI